MSVTKNKMISASKNFMASVNIAYDFDNAEKLQNFIPTDEAVKFIDKEILSTADSGLEKSQNPRRAKILIGPYGKGKSYIVLQTLSLLAGNPENKKVFENLAKKIALKNPLAGQNILQYENSGKRLLPVVINGNSSNLEQSFLYALHLTLKKKEFENLMPETHFEAAAKTIEKWQKDYPETFKKFNEKASIKAEEFIRNLRNFDTSAFEEFEKLYPTLTSGSEFNPFAGFDLVDIFEKVNKKLCESGVYSGMYVVYDEFGKYLESSITKATVKDVKLLQDFAEACDRSGKNQLHLLLICHKEIENYIDLLPKQKVDGWKGVSERFEHIHFYNNYSESYALIKEAIIKTDDWKDFVQTNKVQFDELKTKWFSSGFSLFRNFDENVLFGSYPLHPVTTYILPRLSEKIAQNERTLFTFLSGSEKNAFPYLLQFAFDENPDFTRDGKIILFTPDLLFDYFENQLKNEPYTSEIKKHYSVASGILRRVEKSSLEAKIVKTLALIYVLNQFERLPPEMNFIFALFDDGGFSRDEILGAVKNLSENLGCLYLNIHNNFLQLKGTSGVNIQTLISDTVEKRRRSLNLIQVLNDFNSQKYIYPVSYNIKNKMTRYFRFAFISEKDFFEKPEKSDWTIEEKFKSDGYIFGIFDDGEIQNNENDEIDADEKLKRIFEKASAISKNQENVIFVYLKQNENCLENIRRFDAVNFLRKNVSDDMGTSLSDSLLFEEYDVIYRDLFEVVKALTFSFIQPELKKAVFVCGGREEKLYRKSDLTNLLSKICQKTFCKTPVVNNEMLNKNLLTGAALKSRSKLIDAILTWGDASLGLSGNGQEVSFMRSAILRPGILQFDKNERLENQSKKFCLEPNADGGKTGNFAHLFSIIKAFFGEAETCEKSFGELFENITSSKNQIGMRTGLIPLYIAVVLSDKVNNVVIKNRGIEKEVNSKTFSEIAENPGDFTVRLVAWNDEKEKYVVGLEKLFADLVIAEEKNQNGYAYLINAFMRWYRSLCKYAKQIKKTCSGESVKKSYGDFLNILKQGPFGSQEIIFEKIPSAFGFKNDDCDFEKVLEGVKNAVEFYSGSLLRLENHLKEKLQEIFEELNGEKSDSKKSLKNLILDFAKKLKGGIENHIFENGAHSLLKVYENVTNDENATVQKMAEVLTGLSLDDWSDESEKIFFDRLNQLNATLLDFENESADGGIAKNLAKIADDGNSGGHYVIEFAEGLNGKKSFEKVECSVRAKGLEEEIWRTIEEMGQSVTEAEKRQVLVSLLERLC